jgi:DNA-directed RNA polymerase subunit RPC12/RpoP
MPARITQSVLLCGRLIFMDTHGTQPPLTGQEIRCSDCGHRYFVAVQARSGRCQACGNIEFLTQDAKPLNDLLKPSQPGIVFPLPIAKPSDPPHLAQFRGTPDGVEVQEILNRYQIEWQLWAMVVKHFEKPAYHAAYLTHVISEGNFELGTRRYQEHRGVMILSRELSRQADIADLMLERLQNLSLVRMAMEGRGLRLAEWVLALPLQSRIFKYGFVLLGMLLAARLFS